MRQSKSISTFTHSSLTVNKKELKERVPFVSLDQSVSYTAIRSPNKLMIRDASDPKQVIEFSYEEANQLIDRLAAQIVAIPHDTIGVLLSTSYKCICLIYAVIRAGKNLVIIDPNWGSLAQTAVGNEVNLRAVVSTTDVHGPLADRWYVLDWNKKDNVAFEPMAANLAKVIIFTSGTTSKPKGIVLSQAAMIYAYQVGQRCLNIDETTHAGCFYRISGLGILGIHFLFPILFGGSVTILPQYSYSSPEEFWRNVQIYGVNFLYIVPPIVNFLVKEGQPLSQPFGIEELLCVSGAARLDPKIQRQFQEKFAPLANIYGLSECGFAFLFGKRIGNKFDNSVGPAVDLEIKITDLDGNVIETPEVRGRLHVKTDSLFEGYINNEALTQEVVKNGWLDTHDIAYFDSERCVHIVGRCDGTINKGGNLFYLSECEEALTALPQVIEASCIKVSCEIYGEDYVAIVRVKPHSIADFSYENYLANALGVTRAPKRLKVTERELPRNGAGKYDRVGLETILNQ